MKSYTYTYDALSRITGAIDNTNNYSVSNITYDKMGNIETLTRQGAVVAQPELGTPDHFGAMDILDYDYDSGNKLLKVSDTGNSTYGFKDGANQPVEYTYDGNGNMKSDANKGITSISYNHLNMPTEVVFNSNPNTRIEFVYDAAGIKQRKITNDNGSITTTDYAGNQVYENGSLKQFYHAEGYVEPDGQSGYQYVYQYKDIWHNTRITYADDNNDGVVGTTEIRREQNYYPYGLEHRGYNTGSYGAKNNLKTYQGQEFNEDLGLNTHEWKYRMSDPALGRFWQVDPLAEEYVYNGTYNFAENRLGSGIELEGAEVLEWLMQKMIGNAVESPNGVSAHVLGGVKGVANTLESTVTALTDPAGTLESTVNLLAAGASGGNAAIASQIDDALGTNALVTGAAISDGVSNAAEALASGDGIARGEVIGELASSALGAKGLNLASKGVSTAIKANKGSTLYRAVSQTELEDISSNGLRNISGQYETGKLFTNSAENAAQFGKNNYSFDSKANTIIQVKVPGSVMKDATRFTADGMPAISIPANQLQRIKKIKPLNQSPIPNN